MLFCIHAYFFASTPINNLVSIFVTWHQLTQMSIENNTLWTPFGACFVILTFFSIFCFDQYMKWHVKLQNKSYVHILVFVTCWLPKWEIMVKYIFKMLIELFSMLKIIGSPLAVLCIVRKILKIPYILYFFASTWFYFMYFFASRQC